MSGSSNSAKPVGIDDPVTRDTMLIPLYSRVNASLALNRRSFSFKMAITRVGNADFLHLPVVVPTEQST